MLASSPSHKIISNYNNPKDTLIKWCVIITTWSTLSLCLEWLTFSFDSPMKFIRKVFQVYVTN